jgi:hypothetical protein
MVDLKENPLLISTSFYSDNTSVSTVTEDNNGQNILEVDGKIIDLSEKQRCRKMSFNNDTNSYSNGEDLFDIDFLEEFKKIIESKAGIKIDKVILNDDKSE